MIRSRVKLWCSGVTDTGLASFLDRAMLDSNHKAVLESRYSYELALVSILRDDLEKTKYYLNCCLQAFYQVLLPAPSAGCSAYQYITWVNVGLVQFE